MKKNNSICENCKNWEKVDGAKTNKTSQGLCSFMNSRIHTVWQDKNPIQKDIKNNSLVIHHSSQIYMDLGGLEISSTSKEHIDRHTWVWTDGNFGCVKFSKII